MQYKLVSFKLYWLIWIVIFSGLITLRVLMRENLSGNLLVVFIGMYWCFCMAMFVKYGFPAHNYIKQNINDKFVGGWRFIMSRKDFNDPNVRILMTNLRNALLFALLHPLLVLTGAVIFLFYR